MNTTNNKQSSNKDVSVQVTTIQKSISDINEKIDSAHEKFLKSEVEQNALDLATHGLPNDSHPSIEPFIQSIRAFYERNLSDVALALSSETREQVGNLDMSSMNRKQTDLQLQKNKIDKDLKPLSEDVKSYLGRTKEQINKVKRFLNIISAIEILAFIFSFMAIGDSIILSIVWGSVIGTLQTQGIKSVTLFMRDGNGKNFSSWSKRLVWGAVVMVATVLGIFRFSTMTFDSIASPILLLLAPYIFVFISYFLISVMVLYVWHFYPTPSEEQAADKQCEKQNELSQKEAKSKELGQAIDTNAEETNQYAQIHTLLMQAERDIYHRVQSLFMYSCGVFKNTNLIHRKDGISPRCFNEPITPLKKPSYEQWNAMPSFSNPNQAGQ